MGLQDVVNATECRSAALELGEEFGREEDVDYWPKGCYFFGYVNWNNHISGHKRFTEQKVCRSYGKY